MAGQIRSLVIVVTMTVVVATAYKSKRDISPFKIDVMSHQKGRSRNLFFNQPFIDKIIDQQSLFNIPGRSQTISRQALHDLAFKDQTPGLQNSRYQLYKRYSPHVLTTFRNEPLFRSAPLRNRELRGERAVFVDNPFHGQSPSLISDEIFEEQTAPYQTPFKEQLFTVKTPFKNSPHEQTLSDEQALFQKQAAFVEFPPLSDSRKFYRDNSYDKPFDSYGRQKNAQTSSYEGPSMHTEYGNHALELSPMPMVSSSKHLSPSNVEIPATPSPEPIIAHEPVSPMSSAPSVSSKVHSSEVVKTKLESTPALELAGSMSKGNCNTLVDSSSRLSSVTVTTVPSILVRANQSSVAEPVLTSLVMKPSLSVMAREAPIVPSVENAVGPVHFLATKYGAIMTPSFHIQNEQKSNGRDMEYSFAEKPRSSLKNNEYHLKYLMSDMPKNDMKTDTSTSMLNYILSEEYSQKNSLKGNTQESFANYVLPKGLKYGWPLQQHFSQAETSTNYIPLSLQGKTKFILPNIPATPISDISWPIETKYDISTIVPRKSVLIPDTTTSNHLPLDLNLPLDVITNIPNGLSPTIPNSISASIPESMSVDMPMSIPTLNLEQSLHRVGQLQQTQGARNPWYPTGLQLQLGGFGGINYTLHTSNPAESSMELEIAKAGLTLPKLPHSPAFARACRVTQVPVSFSQSYDIDEKRRK